MIAGNQKCTDDNSSVRRTDTVDLQFPGELVHDEQWLVWRAEERDGEETKVPYKPENPSIPTGTASPSDWTDFRPAYEAWQAREDIDGIGFVFTADDDYVGIDMDHVIDDGELTGWADDVVEAVDSYTELSPSGDGLHIVAEGELDEDYLQRQDELGLEMYDESRFFTVTGERLVDANPGVEARQEAVQAVQHSLLDERVDDDDTDVEIDDWDERRARRDTNDAEAEMVEWMAGLHDNFATLHEGGTIHAGDASRDDASYLVNLAFLTGEDPTQMERIARSSSRVRPKWDEQRNSTTWLRREIREAIKVNSETCNKSFEVGE